jgi:hypothetical protein
MTTMSATPPMDTAPASPVADRTPGQAVVSALSLALLLAGGIAAALGADVPRTTLLTLYMIVGIGTAVWAFNSWLTPAARVALSFATSWVIIVVVSGVMAEASAWHPDVAFALVGGAAAVAHLVSLVRLGLSRRPARRSRSRHNKQAALAAPDLAAAAVLAAALAVALVSAYAAKTADTGVGGFLASISPVWFLALLVAVALASGLVWHRPTAWLQAAGTSVTGLILTLTPAIVYGTPRSQSAEKHIALAQLIRDTGGLHSQYAVYNGWPGFFSGIAWIADVARIHDTVSLATFWPALLVVFRIAALRYLAGRFFTSPRLAWGATLLAVLADSLGADYFSPQSLGFVLGLVLFGVALSKRTGLIRLLIVLGLGSTITFTHQLSPYIVGGVLVVLAVFRLTKPWWLPALVLVPAAGWALLHASTISGFISLGGFGNASNFQLPSQSLPGQRELIVRVSIASVGVAGLVLSVFAVITLLRNRRDRRMWAAAFSTLVGVAAVTANAYGNEGILRTVLFAFPWLAILAAPSVFGAGRRGLLAILAAVPVLILTVCLLFGEFGLDGSSVSRRADRAVVHKAIADARAHPDRSVLLLTLGPGDTAGSGPTNPKNLNPRASGAFKLGPQVQAANPSDNAAYDAIVADLASQAAKQSRHPLAQTDVYALYSPAERIYGKEYGLITLAQSDALLHALQRSAFWHPDLQRDGTYSFVLDPAAFAQRNG